MAASIFKTIRKSYIVHIAFTSIFSNLVVFGEPLQQIVLNHISNKEQSVSYDGYNTRSYKNTPANETAAGKAMYGLKSSGSREAANVSTIFFAVEQFGVIGKSFEEDSEDVLDNIFTISLPQDIAEGEYTAILAYDLYGLSAASQTTKSINNSLSYGGKLVVRTDEWTSVKEEIGTGMLKSGLNEVFFNRRVDEAYQYKVKNVRIELKEKNNQEIQLTEKPVNLNGSLYLSGIVSNPDIKQVSVMGQSIPVNNGVFEKVFTNVPKNTKHIDVSFSSLDNNKQVAKFDIQYESIEASHQFTDSKVELEEGSHKVNDLLSGCPVYNAVSFNINEAYAKEATGHVIVKGLSFKDVKALEADLVNVTAGDFVAYRAMKINLPDNMPVQFSIKYDPAKIPEGYTARDIKTFYFDKAQRSWKTLPVDSLDYANNEIVTNLYNNETDFINGVIKMPESPETGSFAPTTISDMKYADPAAGVVSVSPPSANNTGTAATSFPIKLPQGRNGMEPSLEVAYSSDAGNGWMGVGWNLSTPAITLNTKWGAPTFNNQSESEIYSLNGADLVYKDANENYGAPHRLASNRLPLNKRFYLRKEGGYQKIIRRGNNPTDYWWEVTDKQGNKSFYGSYNGSDYNGAIRIAGEGSPIAHWALVRTQDPYGNYVEYTYELTNTTLPNTAIEAKEFYLTKIEYAKKAGVTNYYRVELRRNNYTLAASATDPNPGTAATRADAIINARNGYIQHIDDLLTEVHVSMVQGSTPTRIRSYRFNYTDTFFKKQLSGIAEYDAGNKFFYSNTFEYFNEATGVIAGQSLTIWPSPPNDDISSPLELMPGLNIAVPNGSVLGTSVSSGVSAGLRIGIGIGKDDTNVRNTLGGSFNYSSSGQESKISFIDINGDGLPDKLYKGSSSVRYRPNTGGGFGDLITMTGIDRMNHVKSRTIGYGFDANLFGKIGAGMSWSTTRSETDDYFSDFNGDGLPDLVSGGRVYFNTSVGPVQATTPRNFNQNINLSENVIVPGAIDQSLVQYLKLPTMNELREEHPQFDHVKVWQAPYTGRITISGNAIRTSVSGENTSNVQISIEYPAASGNNLVKSLSNGNTMSMYKAGIDINKGDLLFFRIHNKDYGFGAEVEWNPRIEYTQIPSLINTSTTTIDDNGKTFNSFKADEDFSINNGGGFGVNSGDSNISLKFNLPTYGALQFTDDFTFNIKHTRLNTTNGVETLVTTKKIMYKHESAAFEGDSEEYIPVLSGSSSLIDMFYFFVESTSNVDWGGIKWQPLYSATSGMYYPPVSYRTYDDNVNQVKYWFKALDFPTPVINNPNEADDDFLLVRHNMQDQDYNAMIGGFANEEMPVKINWVVKEKVNSTTSTVHKRTFYIYKYGSTYKYTKSENYNDDLDFNLQPDYFKYYITKERALELKNGDGMIYSAFYIEDRRFAVTNTAGVILETMNASYTSHLPQPFMAYAPVFYGYSYRGWGQFLYNGGIKLQRDQEGELTSPETIIANYGNNFIDASLFNYENQNIQDVDPALMQNPENVPTQETAVRYTFYNQDNEHLRYVNEGIKTAIYGFSGSLLKAKIGRFAEPKLQDIYVDPATISNPQPGVFVGIKQRSESKGEAKSGNLFFGNGTQSKATSNTLSQYIDLNGDRYPDLVTGKIQYTNMSGSLSNVITDPAFRGGDDSEDLTIGISIPAISPNSSNSDNQSNDNPTRTNTSAGINGSTGTTFNSRQWLDMNGDGLIDEVRMTSEMIEVSLNKGYSFTPFMQWASGNYITSNRTNVGGGLSFSSSFAFGFGGATSTANMNTVLCDINGDGLPDLLTSSGSSYQYRINNGKGFENAPGTFTNGTTERDVSVSGNVFGSFTGGFWFMIPVVMIPIKVVFSPSVGANASFSEKRGMIQDINGDGLPDVLFKGANENNNSGLMFILNTVGKTYLLKKANMPFGGNWTLDYAANAKDYNMPHHKWLLNKVETNDGFTPDNGLRPDSALKTISYEKGMYDRREREFLGYEKVKVEEMNPFGGIYRYSITSYHNDNYYLSGAQKHVALYKGSGNILTEQSTLYNLLNPDAPEINPGAVAENNYLQSSLIPNADILLDRSRLFVAVAKVASTSYEGSESLTAIKEFSEYDTNGNIKTFIDNGEGGEDAYRTMIDYATLSLDNGVSFPNKISVYNNGNDQLLRQRLANYNAQGKLELITVKLTPNPGDITNVNRIKFTYDTYGNMLTIEEMDNLHTSGLAFKQTLAYDTTVFTYPITFGNTFGESSSVTYNYMFGIPLLTTDMNGKRMRNRIDNRGRIVEVTGPNEMELDNVNGNGSAWTIRMEYKGEAVLPANVQPATTTMFSATGYFQAGGAASHYAVTRHFDPEFATGGGATTTNQLLTVSIIDGLGQPIQVKKTHLSTNLQGQNFSRWLVDGFVRKDIYGRTVATHLPMVQAYTTNINALSVTTDLAYYDPADNTLSEPMVMTYDERDRALTVKQPGESQQASTSYGINDGRFRQSNGNELGQITTVFSDIRGRQRKVIQNNAIETSFDFSAINELMKVTDNSGFETNYIYDFAGRQTEIQHPDRGVISLKYNKAGNVIEKSTSNLLPLGQKIVYDYDYNRLVKVTYPQNPQNNVVYRYGKPIGDLLATTSNNAVGRLLYQEDATGVQVFAYGHMGELTKNLRSVAVAGYQSFWIFTKWKYDSWNRLQEITYPDHEVVTYGYNTAGMLKEVKGDIPNVTDPLNGFIVKSIYYNDYGERFRMEYGNLTTTTFEYDVRRRMNLLKHTFNGITAISNSYTYDALSNIKTITTQLPQSSLPSVNTIGGPVSHTYTYDNFNRLTDAIGRYTGAGDTTTPYLQQDYTLKMEYNEDHTIKRKTQTHQQGIVAGYGAPVTDVRPVLKTSYVLDYEEYATGAFVAGSDYGYQQPHAVRKITEKPTLAGNIVSTDPRIKEKEIKYDANGNQTEIMQKVGEESISLRKNRWDEENRLLSVDLRPDDKTSHPIAVYTYDAGGERIIKYNMDRMDVASNGNESSEVANDNVMIYPSGLIMGKLKEINTTSNAFVYTKHYYIGSERVGAKTGTSPQVGLGYPTGIINVEMRPLTKPEVYPVSDATVGDAENFINQLYQGYPAPPQMSSINEPDFAPTTFTHALGVLPLSCFYFQSDYLGSSSYITDVTGKVTQHMEYLPFGETLAEEHINSNNSPFKFNGKEYDEETGNYYYGARYYDPKFGIFISVDPLAEKYPEVSSYAYCMNNPVNLVDPNGEDIYRYDKKSGEFILFEKNDDKIDQVGKFSLNKKTGEYELDRDNSGSAKILVDGIAKGILMDGRNFKTQNNLIEIGGKDQPTEQQVKDFIIRYSDDLAGVEVSGYAAGDSPFSDKIDSFMVEKHIKNKWDSCESVRIPKKNALLSVYFKEETSGKGRHFVKHHYHVHPQYAPNHKTPSDEDYTNSRRRNMDHYIYYRDGGNVNWTEYRYKVHDPKKQ